MKRRIYTFTATLLTLLLPLSLSAGETTDKIRNFLSGSTNSPYFPIYLLLGFAVALFSFLKPRFGFLVMLFFMFISTDMQIDQSSQGRAASIRMEDIILLLVTGGWLLNRAKMRSLTIVKHVPVNKSIIFMSLIIVVASLLGYLRETLSLNRGILFTMKRLEYFWLYFMALNILETDEEAKKAVKIMLFLSIIVAIVGIIQFYLFPLSGLTGGGATATSGFGRANTLADVFLIIGGVVFGLLIFDTTTRWKGLLYIVVAVFSSWLLLLTKSRGAYVSIPPLVITIAYFSKSRKVFLGIIVIALLAFMYLIFMFILQESSSTVAHGVQQLTQKHTGDIENQFESIKDVATSGPKADSSFYARYSSWINNFPKIMKHPFLGYGVGSVPLSYFDCHHVREMYETGFIGYIAFLYMNLIIFITTLNLFYMSDDSFTKGLTCGFMGGHIGMLVHGWSIANFYTIMNMEVFWFTIAMIMLLYYNHIQKLKKKNEIQPGT